jgi:hypothetical protein
MVASHHAGSSSTLSTTSLRRNAPSTYTSSRKATRTSTPSKHYVVPPLPVKPRRDRRLRPLHKGYRPPCSPKAPLAPHHAMACGGDQAKALPHPRGLPYRRGPGLSVRCSSGAHGAAELCRPCHQCPRRHPVTAPGALGRRQRPGACRTRLSLPQRSPLAGLVARSQKARADHGDVDGDDGEFAGLCGVGVSPSQSPAGPSHDSSQPQRSTSAEPDRALDLP